MAAFYPAEIIQNGDRILMIFEGGGYVWHEIHTLSTLLLVVAGHHECSCNMER